MDPGVLAYPTLQGCHSGICAKKSASEANLGYIGRVGLKGKKKRKGRITREKKRIEQRIEEGREDKREEGREEGKEKEKKGGRWEERDTTKIQRAQ